jgi:hypothetical protein
MERPKLEVADVFRRYGEAYRQQHGASLSTAPRRVRHALEVCRTAALGGPVEQCEQCSHERIRYNSCRDRHCPKCQSLARAEWIQDRPSELLDTPYFPVVFPLPEQIAVIAYQNKEVVYRILFRAAAPTLRTIAAAPQRLGAESGLFAVLPTCTAWRGGADSRPMAAAGSPAGRDSSGPRGCCAACCAGCS